MQIPVKLTKEISYDDEGREVLRCGFKIGGGIDQDFRQSPQGFTDNVTAIVDFQFSKLSDLLKIF